MKFGSKGAIFGVIWGGFEGFGPCLGVSHPTHPHLGEISQKKTVFFLAAPLNENVDHISEIFDTLANMTIFLRKREIFVFVRGAIVFSIYTFLCGDTDHLHLSVPAFCDPKCGY